MRWRTFKIRQVFAELRYALGNDMPTIELLQLATKLVDTTRVPSASDDDNIVAVHKSHDQLPLDEAFADGGWRIMARDRALGREQFDDDPSLSTKAKSKLDHLMKRAA
jgi:hypothetical protein